MLARCLAFPPLTSSRAVSTMTREPQGMSAFANTPKLFSADSLSSMRRSSDNYSVYTASGRPRALAYPEHIDSLLGFLGGHGRGLKLGR